jgi:hypothetical protein
MQETALHLSDCAVLPKKRMALRNSALLEGYGSGTRDLIRSVEAFVSSASPLNLGKHPYRAVIK